jgi:hypothetical protein
MSFSLWLRNRTSAIGNPLSAIGIGLRNPKAGSRKPLRFRPRLEALEGRWLPSTLTVMNNLDSGPGSLRADIAAANSGDKIVFAPSLNGQTITLTSGQLVINKNLTIQGPGAGQLAISGGNHFRVFEVHGNTNPNVLLSGLTITQGSGRGGPNLLDFYGGGILNFYGSTLTISGCTLSGNSAGNGGAVANYGAALHIVNSTLSGNKAIWVSAIPSGNGGAVYSQLGVSNVTMTGCTFSNNSAVYQGGAVWTHCTQGNTMTIKSCSFSGNVTHLNSSYFSYGNDIYNLAGTLASSLTVSDSVFSNNTPYHFDPIEGPWTNGGGNTFKY